MGDIKGFMKYDRQEYTKTPIDERTKHYNEFITLPQGQDIKEQGARCMDCGIPFCQSGCPVSNIIPDWNDLVHRNRWKEAIERLHKTNNFFWFCVPIDEVENNVNKLDYNGEDIEQLALKQGKVGHGKVC